VFPLTTTSAQSRLQDSGLRALGVTVPLLAARWDDDDPTFDAAGLRLVAGMNVLAPFQGLRRQLDEVGVAGCSEASGAAISGPGTVFSLHPQAAHRLDTLVDRLLGTAAASIRPIPHTVVVRTVTGTFTDTRHAAGDQIATAGTWSFHDERGLIICPVAVAELFVGLATQFAALASTGMSNAAGGVADIAQKAAGTVIQVVDPHGAPFVAPAAESIVVMSGNAQAATLGTDGIATVLAGQTIGAVGTPTRVRWGWGRNAGLGTAPLAPPAPLVTLTRQFLRVVAVDLPWHLVGNRSDSAVEGVEAADQQMPAEFRPVVRDRVNVDYLVDGADTLGAAGGVLNDFVTAGTGLVYGVSPVFDAAVGIPPSPAPGASPDPATHWPRPVPGTPAPPITLPAITADRTGTQDVSLSFPASAFPVGAHVRAYPRRFVVISSISVDQPSFLRGDGAATVVADATPFSLLLSNPTALATGAELPLDEPFVFDLVVTLANGRRRIFGNVSLPVATATPAPPVDPFAGPDLLGLLPATNRSVAPSPVFGIAGQAPPGGGPPTSIIDLFRALTSETTPRIGPRLPTMARFPTMVIASTGPTTAPMPWQAVVSGGSWSRATRSADHDLANPGNPAGADTHAAGVFVDGALAFDAATIAIRRVQPILPFDTDDVQGWMPWVGIDGWVAPAAGTAPAPASGAGAVLRTVAAGAETPELTIESIPIPPANASLQMAINSIINELGGATDPDPPQPAAEGRIVTEIRREFYVSRFGQRDALYSLRRAVGQARRLVVVAGPSFTRTAHADEPARPAGAPPAIDLVEVLADRMSVQQGLFVLIALPRHPDAALTYGGWVRHAFDARNEAVAELQGVAPSRVAVFHPCGFPGRWASIPTTSVIVDDVYALVGTSHWRRRGMTFDEGVDVASTDLTLDATGTSARIRRYRQGLLAAFTHTRAPVAGVAPDADWVRLASMFGCFDLVADLLDQGGLGRVVPLWPGPTDNAVLAQANNVADPDGGRTDQYLTMLAGLIGESPS